MKLVILGAGGYGRTIADIVEQMDVYEDVIFLDDENRGSNVIGKCSDFLNFVDKNTEFYPAFGDNHVRLQWLDRLENTGCRIATIIHPSAYCSPRAVIEHGVAILPKAIVNTESYIRRGTIVNLGALVDHGCVIGECVHICVGAIVKAENRIPDFLKIEAGSVIQDRSYPL